MAIPPWNCDTCGQPINRVEDGYVQWLEPGHASPRVVIVHGPGNSPKHDNRCLRDDHDGDLSLDAFLGPDGLLRLLYVTERYDRNELVEMLKRLHVPGYDQVRDSIAGAAAAGVYDRAEHLSMANIDAILAWKFAQRAGA